MAGGHLEQQCGQAAPNTYDKISMRYSRMLVASLILGYATIVEVSPTTCDDESSERNECRHGEHS